MKIVNKCIKKTENYHHNPNYKMKYPGPEAYHFPTGPSHLSPCMTFSGETGRQDRGIRKEE